MSVRDTQPTVIDTPQELFDAFLREEDLYYTFYSNLYNSRRVLPSNLHSITSSPYSYISGAFGWLATDEGEEFWSALNIKWRKVYNKFKDHLEE